MLLTEWNWADALAVKYEEGFATGQENKEKEKKEALDKAFTLFEKGMSLQEIKLELGFKE